MTFQIALIQRQPLFGDAFVKCVLFLVAHLLCFPASGFCTGCLPVLAVLLSVLQHGLAPRDIEEMLEVGYILPSHGSVGAGFV